MNTFTSREHAEAVEQVRAEVQNLSEPKPTVEVQTAARFACISELFPNSPGLQAMFGQAANQMLRTGMEVGPTVSNLRTALDYYDMLMGIADIDRTTAESWRKPMQKLDKELQGPEMPNPASFLMNICLTFLSPAASVKERYIDLELKAALTADRTPDRKKRVLDYGSSLMIGPLYVMHKDLCQPAEFRTVQYVPEGTAMAKDLTDQANNLISRPSNIDEIVCVDRNVVFHNQRSSYDPVFRAYGICALRPSERNDQQNVDELQRLMDIKEKPGSGVKFHAGDFLQLKDVEEFKATFPEPFDIITMNYVTSNLSREDQIRLHDVARGMLSDTGILVYNHPAYIPEKHSRPATMRSLRFYTSHAAQPWRSQSHVLDALQPNDGLQTSGVFRDNRFQDMRIGAGKLVVNGVAEPIGELIRNA